MTKLALRELNRRNQATEAASLDLLLPLETPPTEDSQLPTLVEDYLLQSDPILLNCLVEFARDGGPNLANIRNVSCLFF